MKNLILIILLTLSLNAKAVPGLNVKAVPEIADPNLGDIASATYIDGQIVIIYNSNYCNMLGPSVCNFFLAHEYGHINLGHILKGRYPAQTEFEADCWAAKNASLQQVQAAYSYFMKEGFMGKWPHTTGEKRAQRLIYCAGF